MNDKNTPINLTIITGMSGSGKTVVMQYLEDMGFFCMDNVPPPLIKHIIEMIIPKMDTPYKFAIGTDMRGRLFFEKLPETLKGLAEVYQIEIKVIFLDAQDDVLVKRYQETRRTHPLASHDSSLTGIKRERELLKNVKEIAYKVIDTSQLRPRDLRVSMSKIFEFDNLNSFKILLTSFGFKHGIPINSDFVFDVRSLSNPFYISSLRPLTGLDREVSTYIDESEGTGEYVMKLLTFLDYIVPTFMNDGKHQLLISVGCTGGQHRSVAVIEKLKNHFSLAYEVIVEHRDIDKKKKRLHD